MNEPDRRPADGSLPTGGTLISDAGRPADAPGLMKEKADQQRGAAAAKGLPELYNALGKTREALARLQATPSENVNVISLHANIAGEDFQHQPFDKKALAEWLAKDLQARVADVTGKIKALGFNAD